MKRILKCTMIVIGTLIGAGFASGQEIVSFFNKFPENGAWGIILSSILFGMITYFTVTMRGEEETYQKMIGQNKLLKVLIKSFILICFWIMLSGIGAFCKTQYSMTSALGIILGSIICFASFLFKFHGLEKINSYLVPIIIVGIVLLYYLNSSDNIIVEFEYSNLPKFNILYDWIQSTLLYVGYNSIVLIPILIELKKYKMNKNDISFFSILVTCILCAMGLMIYYTMNRYYPEIINVEMPSLWISRMLNYYFSMYYGIVILLAVFTTAFSCGYAFLQLCNGKNYIRNCIIMCCIGVLVAEIGFSNLVNMCFPLFGYLGIVNIIYIIIVNKKHGKVEG